MTAQAFDAYRDSYETVVSDSIAFSGLSHDFFVAAKIMQLQALFARCFGAAKPSLLDIGCGVGRMHSLLGGLADGLAGTDISPASLERAAQDHPKVDYRLHHAGYLPWADGSFDATLAICVLHHVPVVERASFLAEMTRVTRPGGRVIIIEHNPFNPLTRLAVARCPFDADAVLLTNKQARRRLVAAGLKDIESRYFLLLPRLTGLAAKLDRLAAAWPVGAQYIASGMP